MSLINKMLQDLDARGGAEPRGDATIEVRPVASRQGVPAPLVAAGAGLVVVVLAAVGYWGWRSMHAAPSTAVVAAAPAAKTPVPPSAATQSAAPQGAAPQNLPQRSAAMPGADTKAPMPVLAQEQAPPAAKSASAGEGGKRRGGGDSEARNSKPVRAAQPAQAVATRTAQDATPVKPAKPSKAAAPVAVQPVAAAAQPEADAAMTSQQRAENEYRRALAALQQARPSEAIAGLEQAVFLYPRHEAARQTLIGLLVESGQHTEAMRHLQLGLGLDPKQTGMAMLLARMQMEQGGAAIDTLARSLPYATGNAEYRALFAGMLQRAQRHGEAAEHYQAALRLQPGQGVWWMGLGISLKAQKRNAEAKEAFQRARDSGHLTAELESFVERQLQQL